MVTKPHHRRAQTLRAYGVLPVLALCSCRPDIEGGASLIDAPRVLAIQSVPAEAAPGKAVLYKALYVGREETDTQRLEWALCLARKPIAVAGSIALECLEPEAPSDVLVSLSAGPDSGASATAMGTLPKDGCRVFGPSPPAPKAGEPAARPADPDSSGGYYQPLRVRVPEGESEYAVGFTRIACGVGSATQEQALEYGRRYRDNENPVIEQVLADPDGEARPLSTSADSPTLLPVGRELELRVSWTECPTDGACGDGICSPNDDRDQCAVDCSAPRGCTGAEPYAYLDPIEQRVRDRREAMRVSWFATAGSFEHDRSGRSEDEAEIHHSDNRWVAPMVPSSVRLWLVLRDDRGGVGFSSFYVRVE